MNLKHLENKSACCSLDQGGAQALIGSQWGLRPEELRSPHKGMRTEEGGWSRTEPWGAAMIKGQAGRTGALER